MDTHSNALSGNSVKCVVSVTKQCQMCSQCQETVSNVQSVSGNSVKCIVRVRKQCQMYSQCQETVSNVQSMSGNCQIHRHCQETELNAYTVTVRKQFKCIVTVMKVSNAYRSHCQETVRCIVTLRKQCQMHSYSQETLNRGTCIATVKNNRVKCIVSQGAESGVQEPLSGN